MHAHHREQSTQHSKFLGTADPDGAMPLDTEAIQFVVGLEPRGQFGVTRQRLAVHLRDQLEQGFVLGTSAWYMADMALEKRSRIS